jgi:hypothetical protein
LNLRRKQLSTQSFWKAQTKNDLKRVYKEAFPGIADAGGDYKKTLNCRYRSVLETDDNF